MLALVLVESLDLDIKEGRGIDLDAALLPDDAGEIHLVGMLHLHELPLEFGVLGIGLQTAEFV